MSLRPPHSLRARLLWFLLAAIAVTAIVQGAVAYRTARAEADELFDYHMQQTALSLGAGMPLAGSDERDAHEPEDFDFVVQVSSEAGLTVFRSSPRIALPRQVTLGYSNLRVQGTDYRIFSLQTRTQLVQVAQDMAVRRVMAERLALRTVAPIAFAAPVLMLLVWWVVSSSLAPVARARRQVAERHADALADISEAGLPDEVLPLVRELNLLFARVRQAWEAQKSFVADAAHELRSPLAALRLQAQSLQRAPDDAARETAVARLIAGIDRATRLVEQLLVLARQQASATSGERPVPLSLARTARAAVVEAAGTAQARGIDLGLGRADDGDVIGRAEALAILVRNLVDNAVKYTPSGGKVDVEVRRDGDRLVLSVEDGGPGIAEGDRARVLDRFYRAPGAEGTGSGLGLAIVKSIADLHGASLSLERSGRLGGLRVAVGFEAAREGDHGPRMRAGADCGAP